MRVVEVQRLIMRSMRDGEVELVWVECMGQGSLERAHFRRDSGVS